MTHRARKLLRIPNTKRSLTTLRCVSEIIFFWEGSPLSLLEKKTSPRSGTRIPCAIPIALISLDSFNPFSEPCQIILVNLRGCAARLSRSVGVGTAVELRGLPTDANVTGRTVNCISLGEHEKIWLLGVELDEPGNVWGIEMVPADWSSVR